MATVDNYESLLTTLPTPVVDVEAGPPAHPSPVADIVAGLRKRFPDDGVMLSVPLEESEKDAAPPKAVLSEFTMSPIVMPEVTVTLACLPI